MHTPPQSNRLDSIVAIKLMETMLKYIRYEGLTVVGLKYSNLPNIVHHTIANDARIPP